MALLENQISNEYLRFLIILIGTIIFVTISYLFLRIVVKKISGGKKSYAQFILKQLSIPVFFLVFIMSVKEGPSHLFGYITVLVGIAIIRGTYAYIRTSDKVFFLFPFYAFCHIFLLIPVRMYALCTLKTTKWGTR